MSTLRITVEWLDGDCHAREWPPVPFRLYQALVAGAALHGRRDPGREAALRHLETLPPPVITAPPAECERAVTASVPNNDGDRVLALLAKGERGRARTLRERSVTLRTRRRWRFDGAVVYDWEATPGTAAHVDALAAMARCVSAVGLGIDLAVVLAARIECPGPAGVAPRRAPVRTTATRGPLTGPYFRDLPAATHGR